jgi:hypothetical protein
MGLFNTVEVAVKCPRCNQTVPLKVQFKHGATRQYSYKVGDEIEWGANDVGDPKNRNVVVLGVPESCANCGHDDDREFYVYFNDDTIDSVELADGTWDLLHLGADCVVLDGRLSR